mgnify:CR=1 FL=1
MTKHDYRVVARISARARAVVASREAERVLDARHQLLRLV